MGLREYARHRAQNGLIGGTLAAVQKAITSGRINVQIVGKSKRIDPVEADVAWGANTAPKEEPPPAQPGSQRTIPGMEDTIAASGVAEIKTNGYHHSRAARELYDAALTKLKYEREVGDLIETAEVNRQIFGLAREVRDAMLNIPDRIAAQLASTTDEHKVHALLSDEINSSLAGFSAELAKRAADAAIADAPAA